MNDYELAFFIGIAVGIFLPLLDYFSHWLSIKIFGEFKDKL